MMYNGGVSNLKPLLFIKSRVDVFKNCEALVTRHVHSVLPNVSTLRLFVLVFWDMCHYTPAACSYAK